MPVEGAGIKVGQSKVRRISVRTMEKKIIVRTGEKAPVSGIYRPSGSEYEATFDKGERVPPNNEGSRQIWYLVHKAKHKNS